MWMTLKLPLERFIYHKTCTLFVNNKMNKLFSKCSEIYDIIQISPNNLLGLMQILRDIIWGII